MSIDFDLARLTELSKLYLSPDEETLLKQDLSDFLILIGELPPLSSSLSAKEQYPLREDVVFPSLPIEDILRNAPSREDHYFVLPKTVE